MAQRVRPLKIESLGEGGGQNDAYGGQTEVDVGEDFIDAAGLTLQRLGANTNTADALVRLERTTAGSLHFVDTVANGTAGLDLSQLLTSATGAVGSFNALQDVRLWVDGPGDGFPSGAVKIRIGTAPNSGGYIWYKSSAMTARLFDCTITYATGSIGAATKVYRLYAPDGITVVRTLTDTFTWNGPVMAQKTRSWS